MTRARAPHEDLETLAAAAAWRVALSEAGQDSCAEFEAWLARDPRHGEAWARVEAPWEHVGRHATAPEAMAAREEALKHARRGQRRRLAARRPGWGRIAASIAAAVMLACGAGAGVWSVTKPDVYRTALGERRTVTLEDGSRVTLDSGALVKVRLERDARELELVRGQARFDVAHDAARPFSVQARDQRVVATGTSFNVDLLGPRVLVTLIEGKVTVLRDPRGPLIPLAPRPKPAVLARLSAGQQLVAVASPEQPQAREAEPVVRIVAANLERASAWESGQLVFEDEPLAAVAERVSRYSAESLTVEGPAADLRISGVFNAGDTATFVDAVQRGLAVRAERTAGGVVLRMAAP